MKILQRERAGSYDQCQSISHQSVGQSKGSEAAATAYVAYSVRVYTCARACPCGRVVVSVPAPVPVPVAPEPVYQQEAAYTADIGPLEVLDFGSDGTMDDEIFGGALLALKNPNYWDNMMMPG